MLNVLAQREFPASRVKALASARSAGKTLPFAGGELTVEEMTPDSFADVDIALFATGGDVSLEYAEIVTGAGAVMIDNSSAFRMYDDVPLVVPEVNAEAIAEHSGIIANPNGSTLQMVVALAPLHRVAKIKRVVVSTYQAASGAGAEAMAELYNQTREFLDEQPLTIEFFAHQIAFNLIPHIDVFLEDGTTKEEWKMVVETKKIMGDDSIEVAANCVRVPVLRSHSEMVNVEFSEPMDVEMALAAWKDAPGLEIMDDPEQKLYPMPGLLAGTDPVYVGRLRKDPTVEWGLNFWNVSDQIRKGAALNAIQIAEALLP
jgi:aspartate-semialdehyde dehydrogenase